MDITIKPGIRQAEAPFISTSELKQGHNLIPILFLFAFQATIDIMHQSWTAEKYQSLN